MGKAFLDKEINNRAFSQESCLVIKSLPVVGSFNTKQLFSIKSTCNNQEPLYFIAKEAADGEREASSLQEIENFPGLKKLMISSESSAPEGFPNLALPIIYLSYKDNNGREHYLAIMPYAPGRVLCDVVKDYRDSPTPLNAERIKKIYKNIGTQLGNFHRSFMTEASHKYSALKKTILHGDLHCLNTFYDEKSSKTTLIDNETIANFLKNPSTPDDDILKLFLGPFSKTEPESRKDLIKNIDLKTWFNLAFANFVDGYAQSFPEISRKELYQDLKKIFNFDTYQKPSWLSISADRLRDLREKYINPILDKKLAE